MYLTFSVKSYHLCTIPCLCFLSCCCYSSASCSTFHRFFSFPIYQHLGFHPVSTLTRVSMSTNVLYGLPFMSIRFHMICLRPYLFLFLLALNHSLFLSYFHLIPESSGSLLFNIHTFQFSSPGYVFLRSRDFNVLYMSAMNRFRKICHNFWCINSK